MEGENINIIENIIQAVSILNKTDEYLESLTTRLSECDILVSDYEHFIENTPIDEVNLKKLYQDMQNNFIIRRKIKNNITINNNYKNLTSRFNCIKNRELLIQDLKNVQSKLGVKYHNKKLTQDEITKLKDIQIEKPKKRGRPKKVKEGIEFV